MVPPMNDSSIEAILARRTEIAAEIERLRAEDIELEIAVRVLSRFDGPKAKANGVGTEPRTDGLGPVRPKGTPTLFEMTETVLRDAVAAGKPGLTGSQIVEEIAKKYWPGLQKQQVLPPIYGFVSKKRLRKTDTGIFSPK
jgi:hypothetical protein